MYDFYINLRCRKCGRFVGTTKRGSIGQEKLVGCKQCGLSTTITLKEHQQLNIGDLEITTGFYTDWDS